MMTAKRAFMIALLSCIGLFMVYMLVLIVKNLYTLSHPSAVDPKVLAFDASIEKAFSEKKDAKIDMSELERGDHPFFGKRNAAIHIVEFVDFHCPYCKRVAPILRTLVASNPDVFVIIRDAPLADLHPLAEKANAAASCVWRGSGKARLEAYGKMYDALFVGDPVSDDDALRSLASDAGANMSAYDSCIQNGEALPDIQSSLDLAERSGLVGTPTFFVNGVRIQGAPDSSQWDVILGQARAVASHPLAKPSIQ